MREQEGQALGRENGPVVRRKGWEICLTTPSKSKPDTVPIVCKHTYNLFSVLYHLNEKSIVRYFRPIADNLMSYSGPLWGKLA